MATSQEHSELMRKIILALGTATRGRCIVWRNETGMGLNPRTYKPFRYGLAGSPDIIGFTNRGAFIGIEVKTGNAKQSAIQKNFNAAANKFNALYFIARDVESTLAFVISVTDP